MARAESEFFAHEIQKLIDLLFQCWPEYNILIRHTHMKFFQWLK
jgi:hypothetical protein